MNKILKAIIEQKHHEIRLLKDIKNTFTKRSDPKRPFAAALDKPPELALIAEVKKASPSKGVIRADFDPVKIAAEYENNGAAAVSVLTDEKFFQGHIDYLKAVRENISLAVLRKDFIIDILQVRHTASMNADAMLLIAAALDDSQLKDLFQTACELEIEPLIEIHNTVELDRVMKLEPQLIGINNRNLDTFVTDINITVELVKHIPRSVTVISESGVSNGSEAKRLAASGVRALLVGESLMRAADTGGLMRELRLSAAKAEGET
ncbi:MAG: indole-3-glycerol phosphate synthase TrpC [Chitinispirillales bacterium]|jgi:indole-3-glycerol phosphate synthase|nr:indole-3-glycerol phosphate synthase TrpC [Chitinispirillales bacterium]